MFRRRLSAYFFGVALAAVGSGLAQTASGATIYKWVDEKGVTHYSESPPPKTKSRPVEVQTAPSPPAKKAGSTTAQSLQEQEREFQERRKEREAAMLKEEMQRQAEKMAESDKKRKCAEAKTRLAHLQKQKRGPAATRNAKGEIEWWNFEQRGIEINELGKFIDQNCPPD